MDKHPFEKSSEKSIRKFFAARGEGHGKGRIWHRQTCALVRSAIAHLRGHREWKKLNPEGFGKMGRERFEELRAARLKEVGA